MDKKTGNHQQVSYSNEADIILSGPAAVQGHVTEVCINQKRTIASVCPESKDKLLVASKTRPSEQKRLSATGTSHMLFLQAMFCRGHQSLLAMFYIGNQCLLAMFYIGKQCLLTMFHIGSRWMGTSLKASMFTGHVLHRKTLFGRKPHLKHQCLLAMFYTENQCLDGNFT